MKDTDKFNGKRRQLLACAITAALFAPLSVSAADGQQVADGIQLSLAAGDYVADGQSALLVRNQGQIIANGEVDVGASGTNAYGANVNGARSSLLFSGGSIGTAGQNGHGVYVSLGGEATFSRDQGGIGTTISTSGNYAHAIYETGSDSAVSGVGLTIDTSGIGSNAARNEGGQLSLSDSVISTTGSSASGIYANAGALTDLSHVSITTQGLSAHVVYLDGSRGGSTAQISGATFSTSGDEAAGIYLAQGAQADLLDTDIQTTGARAYGVSMNQSGSRIFLDQVTVVTSGDDADAVWAPGNSVIEASHFAVETTGNGSLGVDDRASTITLTNGTILTKGANAHALYASKESGSDAVIQGDGLAIYTEGSSAIGTYARLGGQVSLSDSQILTTGSSSHAVISSAGSSVSLANTSIQTKGENAYGLYVTGNAAMDDGSILTQGMNAHGLVVLNGGQVSLNNVDVLVQGGGAYGAVIDGAGSTLSMDAGSLMSRQGPAFVAAGDAIINLSHGAQVTGGDGLLLDVADPGGHIVLAMNNEVAAWGDILLDPSVVDSSALPFANANVSLSGASQWVGATEGAVSDLSLEGGSLWVMTNDSSVGQLTLDNAGIQFAAPVNGGYKTLTVGGDFSGAGGVIGLNTLLNEGGPLSNQQTDRLVIQGNVTTTGTTVLDIAPRGTGASAPVDKHGVAGAADGMSLVQVGGASRADAFALRYGYVAVGPYQYRLYAFGPGQTDASQSVLPSGDLNWDYRLAPKYVEVPGDSDGDPDPVAGGTSLDPSSAYPQQPVGDLVAQMPSYIVAPTALLAYGDTMIDTLHQRLGDIRDTSSSDSHDGELFVRYIGSQQRYASRQSMYGYDFDQQINAAQLGGSLVSVVNNASSLRVGWALDKGTTRVTPRVPDSEDASFSRYDAHGVSAWLTWQQANGFYVDAVVGGERYQGSVSTAAREDDVAKIRANGWLASVETGYPLELGGGWWAEPQLQIKQQSLSFPVFQDADNLDTQIKVGDQTSTRAGVRLAKTDDPIFVPYVRADFIRTVGGLSKITTSSEAWGESGTFDGVRSGDSVRLGAGAASRILPYLSIYGEAGYQRNTSDDGLRGWQANLGVRFEF